MDDMRPDDYVHIVSNARVFLSAFRSKSLRGMCGYPLADNGRGPDLRTAPTCPDCMELAGWSEDPAVA